MYCRFHYLRKRGEDIQLAQHFLASLALNNDNKVKVFHPRIMAQMEVTQGRNVIGITLLNAYSCDDT